MWDWIWLGYHGNSIQDPYVKKDHIEPTLSTFGRFIWPITWTKNSHSKTWHLPERLGFFWMPVSPLIFALLVVSQKRRFFKTECAFPERNMWVFRTHSSRYEIMFFALEARALSKHKHYRRIFVYTLCLINICLWLSDDANKIKTLNIERA